MASIGLDCLIVRPQIANGGTDSAAFSVPRGAKSMTLIFPAALTGTVNLQTFIPDDTLTGSNSWTNVQSLLDANTIAAPTMPTAGASNNSAVYDYKWFGGGALRLHSGSSEGALRQFYVIFHMEK